MCLVEEHQHSGQVGVLVAAAGNKSMDETKKEFAK